MLYTDTRNKEVRVSFKEAVLNGLAKKTGGLYVPCEYPSLPTSIINKVPESSFREIAFNMARLYTGDEIEESALLQIIQDAYPFSPKVVPLDPNTYLLELFHGPTCAFKDFGARFMARVMSYFNKDADKLLHILVATSGDTGSAVGNAFLGVKGIDVTILYPKGKVSLIQEKQLATFTGNVRALKVEGTFDDCQRLVKTAFMDDKLRSKFNLTSANSINIARLLPQSFYYMYASLVVKNRAPLISKIEKPSIIVTVPSGNFGNLVSGLIAKRMGACITGFVAATNANNTIPSWIATGEYKPMKSVETYANAMDVGAPSNYERLVDMYSLEEVRKFFASYWLTNEGIINAMKECYKKTGYIIDPHGAVAYKAWSDIKSGAMLSLVNGIGNDYKSEGLTPNIPDWSTDIVDKKAVGLILETAHNSKFSSIVKKAINRDTVLPERLEDLMNKEDRAVEMGNDYEKFSTYLYDTFTN